MKKKTIRVSIAIILSSILVYALWLFVPRHYALPTLAQRPTTQYVTLSTGSKIGYTLIPAQGEKKNAAVIYLHGGPGGRVSDLNIATLSELSKEGYDVLFYDQIGSGYSYRLSNMEEYTVERHLNDLEALIKHFKFDSVALIGQSWGCILAAYFLAKYPGMIEKVAFINPGPLFPYPKGLEKTPAPDSLDLRSPVFTNAQGNAKTQSARIKTVEYWARHFGLKMIPDAEMDAFSTWAGFEVNKSCVFDTSKMVKIAGLKTIPSLNGYYAGLMTFESLQKSMDPRPFLKGLELPVLVVKAQYDNQKWGFTQEYLALFKNSRLKTIRNAGHFIELEQPDALLQTLIPFLNGYYLTSNLLKPSSAPGKLRK